MLVRRKSNPFIKAFKVSAPFLFVLGLGLIVYFVPIFKVKGVVINGDGLSSSDVHRFLGDDVIGSNIFFWEPSGDRSIEAKVSKIEVDKNFWEREIAVTITKRLKYMTWCYEKTGNCFWADDMGYLFENAPNSSGRLIKVVSDNSDVEVQIGGRVQDADMFERLKSILMALEDLDLVAEKIAIEDIKLKELVVYLTGGPKIYFGLDIDQDFIGSALDSFLKSDGWGKIKSINLTVYGRGYASF